MGTTEQLPVGDRAHSLPPILTLLPSPTKTRSALAKGNAPPPFLPLASWWDICFRPRSCAIRVHLVTVSSSDALLCALADPATEQKAWGVATDWPFNAEFEFLFLSPVWTSGCVWGPGSSHFHDCLKGCDLKWPVRFFFKRTTCQLV